MEIKIECACGTNYKFEVEAIHGRMPMPVNCPSCGADGTAQANAILRKNSAGAAAAEAAPGTPARGTPVVRLSASPPAIEMPPPRAAAPMAPATPQPARKPEGKGTAVVVACLVLLVFGLGAWKLGPRWYRRVSAMVEVARDISQVTTELNAKQNFWQEDCVVLFIRHTNHAEIAEACQRYWKENLNKELMVKGTLSDELGEREYCIIGAHNGYIRLTGGLEWPNTNYEGLALDLSRQFNTLVFETRDVDFSGAYHFGVYEQGTRKFHAQMDVKPAKEDFQEVVTTEGNEWALAHGFKPGREGLKAFHMGNAEEIAQKAGLKMWDEKEDERLPILLLKEL